MASVCSFFVAQGLLGWRSAARRRYSDSGCARHVATLPAGMREQRKVRGAEDCLSCGHEEKICGLRCGAILWTLRGKCSLCNPRKCLRRRTRPGATCTWLSITTRRTNMGLKSHTPPGTNQRLISHSSVTAPFECAGTLHKTKTQNENKYSTSR